MTYLGLAIGVLALWQAFVHIKQLQILQNTITKPIN